MGVDKGEANGMLEREHTRPPKEAMGLLYAAVEPC